MQYAMDTSAKVMVIKLDAGEKVVGSLKAVFEKEGIRSAIILCGIGMLSEFELGYFDGHSHKARAFTTPHELTSMSGSLAYVDGQPMIHLHATLGNEAHQVVGGHFGDGTVGVLAEITVAVLDTVALGRKKNERTGLFELTVKG